MVSIKIIQLAVMAAAVANAAPTTSATGSAPDAIFKRADTAAVTCGATSANQAMWTQAQVQDAYDSLVAFGQGPANQRRRCSGNPLAYFPPPFTTDAIITAKAGNRVYPMQYGTRNNNTPRDDTVVAALNAIPGCQTGQQGFKYFEFPITNPSFTGGNQGEQGPDRVIAISPSPGQGGTRQYAYCLSVTHRDEKKPGEFDPCT